jgi:hypothetical protein
MTNKRDVQIDRSVVESFGGGGRVCIVARVYPRVLALAVDGGTHMYVFNNGSSNIKIPRLEAWSMKRAQHKSIINVNKNK